jgi:hypothetical protein
MVLFLPLVARRHQFATSSTSLPGRAPTAHGREQSGGLTTASRSLAPPSYPVHTSRHRPSTHHILGMAAVPRRLKSVPTFSGRPIRRHRVPYSFLRAYLSTDWITFGILIRTVERKTHLGKVLMRVHSNTIRRYHLHCPTSPQIVRVNNCHFHE